MTGTGMRGRSRRKTKRKKFANRVNNQSIPFTLTYHTKRTILFRRKSNRKIQTTHSKQKESENKVKTALLICRGAFQQISKKKFAHKKIKMNY